ncbi:hypothetical protein F2Q70_00037329 [Brassica cretica]|nr:hypothetical protein F2Q70_00037329 [Brassica cretica]
MMEEFVSSKAVPRQILVRAVNTARVIDLFYKEGNGFGHPDQKIKDILTSLFLHPIPLSKLMKFTLVFKLNASSLAGNLRPAFVGVKRNPTREKSRKERNKYDLFAQFTDQSATSGGGSCSQSTIRSPGINLRLDTVTDIYKDDEGPDVSRLLQQPVKPNLIVDGTR